MNETSEKKLQWTGKLTLKTPTLTLESKKEKPKTLGGVVSNFYAREETKGGEQSMCMDYGVNCFVVMINGHTCEWVGYVIWLCGMETILEAKESQSFFNLYTTPCDHSRLIQLIPSIHESRDSFTVIKISWLPGTPLGSCP